jgi:hypothetical protein
VGRGCCGRQASPDTTGLCTFRVDGQYGDGQRKLTLRAEAEHECLEWVAVLRKHVQRLSDQQQAAAGGEGAGDGVVAAAADDANKGVCRCRAPSAGLARIREVSRAGCCGVPLTWPVSLSLAAADAAVYCQGWLAKRSGGNKSTGATVSVGEIRKNWETRWFVLQALLLGRSGCRPLGTATQ